MSEAYEWDDYPEYDDDYPERAPRRAPGRTPPRAQPRNSYTPPAAPQGFATKRELTEALAKVREDIAKIARSAEESAQRNARMLADQAKKNDARFASAQQTTLLTTVLGRPEGARAVAPVAGTDIVAGDRVLVERQGRDSSLLPLLLLSGGLGGNTGSGTNDNSGMLIAALALSGSL